MNERICPNCGEHVTDARARFCPICATALPEAARTQAPDLERALLARYEAYNAWVLEYRKNESTGRRFWETLLGGGGSFKNHPEHEAFFNDVKAGADALLEAYRAAPGTGDVAGLLRAVLIDCHHSAHCDADWLFLAVEQVYLPYLELLTPSEAAGLYPDYQTLRKKQKGFAYQTQILKKLKRLSRG